MKSLDLKDNSSAALKLSFKVPRKSNREPSIHSLITSFHGSDIRALPTYYGSKHTIKPPPWGLFHEGPEKPLVKLRSAYLEKLTFQYFISVRKTKRIAKFHGEDIKSIVAPEVDSKSFGTFLRNRSLAPLCCSKEGQRYSLDKSSIQKISAIKINSSCPISGFNT